MCEGYFRKNTEKLPLSLKNSTFRSCRSILQGLHFIPFITKRQDSGYSEKANSTTWVLLYTIVPEYPMIIDSWNINRICIVMNMRREYNVVITTPQPVNFSPRQMATRSNPWETKCRLARHRASAAQEHERPKGQKVSIERSS